MVSAWKREVYAARYGINIREWSKEWAKELRQASTKSLDDDLISEKEAVEGIMIDQLEDMVQERQITLPEAKAAYEVAMGRRVILADHKDDYLKRYRNQNIKTQPGFGALSKPTTPLSDDQHLSGLQEL